MCDCNKYYDLKIDYDELTRREKEFKNLSNQLVKIADCLSNSGKTLYKCPDCHQYWQSSWVTYGKILIFKVPTITIEDWQKEQFVTPTSMYNFLYFIGLYLNRLQQIRFTNEKCRTDNCNNKCINLSVFCLRHHIINQNPDGIISILKNARWFSPYKFEDFELTDERIEKHFKTNGSPNSILPKMGEL